MRPMKRRRKLKRRRPAMKRRVVMKRKKAVMTPKRKRPVTMRNKSSNCGLRAIKA